MLGSKLEGRGREGENDAQRKAELSQSRGRPANFPGVSLPRTILTTLVVSLHLAHFAFPANFSQPSFPFPARTYCLYLIICFSSQNHKICHPEEDNSQCFDVSWSRLKMPNCGAQSGIGTSAVTRCILPYHSASYLPLLQNPRWSSLQDKHPCSWYTPLLHISLYSLLNMYSICYTQMLQKHQDPEAQDVRRHGTNSRPFKHLRTPPLTLVTAKISLGLVSQL